MQFSRYISYLRSSIRDLWVALTGNLWWAEMDSNHRPLGYQPSALTS